jgi:hypothetical protein
METTEVKENGIAVTITFTVILICMFTLAVILYVWSFIIPLAAFVTVGATSIALSVIYGIPLLIIINFLN